MTDTRPPAALREAVARSIAPVRRLAPPGRRALIFVALGLCLLLGVPVVWGVREDAADLGSLLWALSALQVGMAALLFRLALVESIPGRLAGARRALSWGALGLALMLGVTAATFVASPSYVPPQWAWSYLYTCSTRTFALGVPALAIAGLLLRRGLTARPVLAGALAGFASGLLADSGWRLYCETSAPTHVLAAHSSGVLALSTLGTLAGALVKLDLRTIGESLARRIRFLKTTR